MSLYELVINDREKTELSDVFLTDPNKTALTQLIKEYNYKEQLAKYNLQVNNKILLYGDSGCGKTMTAKAIANALGKKMTIVNLSTLVNAKIGETSRNIKALFDKVAREEGVLFLDEFDQMGKMRGNDDKDVGEMRRLVNTIIQLIDYFPSNSLLIGATNHYDIIDTALIRRFQLRLKFETPDAYQLDAFYDKILLPFPKHLQDASRKYNISYAEAKDYIHTLLKSRIIEELEARF